jgi:3-dehydroquinate dehydratase/shikimate dehydrogenase
MGDTGDAPRLLALREGSALAYATMARAVAPGQLSLSAMQHVYRVSRRFGPSAAGPARGTRVYGVIGDPIAHSLSPLMHNAAFAARGLNAIYLPFRVRDLRDFIQAVRAFGISGFSVTLPHKQRILEYLDGCDSLAAEIGAVNTVQVRGENRLYGYNTDYAGVLHAIERRVPLAAGRVLLVGAGGSARAVAFALASAGATVIIWARRQAQARTLARAVGGEAIPRAALRRENFDAIVNCTPVGMYPGGGSLLDAAELNTRVVMDLIYRPRKTELLKRAERRGIAVISGVEMFLAQGAAQWEIWTGRRAPQNVMRRAVLAALAAEERAFARR